MAQVPLILMPTLAVSADPLKDVLACADGIQEAAILIGPEGDFTRAEVLAAQAHGVRPVSLGRLTLRSETAALAVLAILAHRLP